MPEPPVVSAAIALLTFDAWAGAAVHAMPRSASTALMSLDGDSPEAEHVLGGNILLPRVVVLVTSAAERGGTRLQTRLDATR